MLAGINAVNSEPKTSGRDMPPIVTLSRSITPVATTPASKPAVNPTLNGCFLCFITVVAVVAFVAFVVFIVVFASFKNNLYTQIRISTGNKSLSYTLLTTNFYGSGVQFTAPGSYREE